MSRLRTGAALLGLIALCTSGMGADPQVDSKLVRKLLALYKRFHLPIPPQSAPMVWIPNVGSYGVQFESWKEDGRINLIGYLLPDGKLLVATQKIDPRRGMRLHYNVAVLGPEMAKKVYWASVATTYDQCLPLAAAMIEASRGHVDSAKALISRSLVPTWIGHGYSEFCQPADAGPEERLGFLGLTHYANLALDPTADRLAIYQEFGKILDSGTIRRQKLAPLRRFAAHLRESARPIRGAIGSPERAVDELVLCRDAGGWPWGSPRIERADPLVNRVVAFGMDAIPALAEHVPDHRLTYANVSGMMNAPSRVAEVSDFVELILSLLSDGHISQRTDLWSKEQVLGWLTAKRTGTMAPFLLDQVFPVPTSHGPSTEKTAFGKLWPRQGVLNLVSERYPALLVDAYRMLIDRRHDVDCRSISDSLFGSGLGKEIKQAAFRYGIDRGDYSQRTNALANLSKLDGAADSGALIQAIQDLGDLADYPSLLAYMDIMTALSRCGDPTAWASLDRKLRSLPDETRVLILANLSYGYDASFGRGRWHAARLAVSFANDRAEFPKRPLSHWIPSYVRDTYQGWTAGDAALCSLREVLGHRVAAREEIKRPRTERVAEAIRELQAQGMGILAARIQLR